MVAQQRAGKRRAGESVWFSVLFILFCAASAAAAGMAASLAPTLAAVASGILLGGGALWLLLRRMPASSLTATKAGYLVQLGFACVLMSLIRIAERDPVSSSLGVQAIFEFSLQGLAAALVVFGMVVSGARLKLSLPLMLWIAFGVFAIVSAFWAPQPLLAATKGAQLMVICAIATTVAYQFRDRYDAVRFLTWMTVFILFGAILVQGFIGGAGNLLELGFDGRYRLSLLSIHPIILGSFSGAVVLLLLVNRPRGSDWLAVPLLLSVSLLTSSRTPLGVLCLLLLCYAVLRSRLNAQSFIAWALAIVIFGIGVLAGVPGLPDSSTQTSSTVFGNLENDLSTLNGRVPIWMAVLDRADSTSNQELSVLLGHGFVSFRHFGLDQFLWGGDAHNSVIQVFSELGVIGVVLWTLAVAACIRHAWTLEGDFRWRLIATLPILYILGTQMTDASLADSRSFLLVVLMFYAHAGWGEWARAEQQARLDAGRERHGSRQRSRVHMGHSRAAGATSFAGPLPMTGLPRFHTGVRRTE